MNPGIAQTAFIFRRLLRWKSVPHLETKGSMRLTFLPITSSHSFTEAVPNCINFFCRLLTAVWKPAVPSKRCSLSCTELSVSTKKNDRWNLDLDHELSRSDAVWYQFYHVCQLLQHLLCIAIQGCGCWHFWRCGRWSEMRWVRRDRSLAFRSRRRIRQF